MASNTSKTARASVRAGQAGQGGALSVLGEFKYLIPLNGGKLRLRAEPDQRQDRAPPHRLRRLRRGDPACWPAPDTRTKIRAEISGLAAAFPGDGWDTTEKRLVEAGVFTA